MERKIAVNFCKSLKVLTHGSKKHGVSAKFVEPKSESDFFVRLRMSNWITFYITFLN